MCWNQRHSADCQQSTADELQLKLHLIPNTVRMAWSVAPPRLPQVTMHTFIFHCQQQGNSVQQVNKYHTFSPALSVMREIIHFSKQTESATKQPYRHEHRWHQHTFTHWNRVYMRVKKYRESQGCSGLPKPPHRVDAEQSDGPTGFCV